MLCGVSLEIRLLDGTDAALVRSAADGVFDHAPQKALTDEFLSDPRHRLVGAIKDGVLVGFVSAVRYVHPDKEPELWINEVGVAPEHQRQGIGRRMLEVMLAQARSLGCVNAWVLTDRENAAAMGLYERAGGSGSTCEMVMFEFPIGRSAGADGGCADE